MNKRDGTAGDDDFVHGGGDGHRRGPGLVKRAIVRRRAPRPERGRQHHGDAAM